MAQAGGMSRAEQFKIAVELALKVGVERAHAERGRELDDTHGA